MEAASRISFTRLVFTNIRRRPYRNIATILCFAFIASSFLSARYLISGTNNSLDVGLAKMGADIMVVPQQAGLVGQNVLLTGEPSSFIFENSPELAISNVAGVSKLESQVYLATLSASCCAYPVELIGFNQSNDFTVTPWVNSTLGRQLMTNEVLVGCEVMGDEGTQLVFYGTNFTIAGRLGQTGMGMDRAIFMQMEDAYTMAANSRTMAVSPINVKPGQVSAILVRVDPGADVDSVAASIEFLVPGSATITPGNLIKTVSEQISSTTQLLYVTAASVLIVSLPLIALVSSMVVNERRREIGILRSMGASKGFVLKLFFSEAIVLSLVGGALGAGASFAIVYSFQSLIAMNLDVPFLWPSIGPALMEVGLALVLVVAAGALASLIPVARTSRLGPYETIRSGEA